MLQCYKVAKWRLNEDNHHRPWRQRSVSVLSYMKYPQPLGWEIADVERLGGSCSEYDGAVAHARGGSEGSQGCREDADDDLQDGLPSFFLHGAFMVFLG